MRQRLPEVVVLSVLAMGAVTATDAQEAILIDHTCTDIDAIPAEWIAAARELAIHYAHTSHGSQLMSGLGSLMGQDATLAYDVFYAGPTPPTDLGCVPGDLCVFDGNPPETYVEPDDYWSTSGGRDRTEAVADTGLFGFSMWSWCGQQSSNDTAAVQIYLDTMAAWEAAYPGMRFVLMTGHTDGGGATLEQNNDQVRQFAADHGMVLFDFADIESWDPGGIFYPDTSDACEWCSDWCAAHPADCVDLPSCAHSHGFNCVLKGRAMWWMMARLAGWPGPGAIFADGFETGDVSSWAPQPP